MKTVLMMHIVIISLFSITGAAIQNGSDLNNSSASYFDINNYSNTTVVTKFSDRDEQNSSIVVVNVKMNQSGNLTYIERYYLIDKSGELKYDRSAKYYDKYAENNNLTFKILRPNSSLEKPYPVVEALVNINNQSVFQGWVKKIKFTSQSQRLQRRYEEDIKISIIAVIITILVIFVSTRPSKPVIKNEHK